VEPVSPVARAQAFSADQFPVPEKQDTIELRPRVALPVFKDFYSSDDEHPPVKEEPFSDETFPECEPIDWNLTFTPPKTTPPVRVLNALRRKFAPEAVVAKMLQV
jgi:hypothetical protein